MRTFLATLLIGMGLAVSAYAHHSMNGFDRAKTINITGTVKQFKWANPHSWIEVEVINDKGVAELWNLEMTAPGILARAGWKSTMLKPGDKVTFHVRTFDAHGNLIGEQTAESWSLDQLKGTIDKGQFVASTDDVVQAGLVKATIGGLSGTASVRIFPPFPWSETFDSFAVNSQPLGWVNTTLKFTVRELNGNKVLVKLTEGSSLLSRARAYLGPSDLSNYTIESDIFATQKRRQQGDAGVIAQRYVLTLYGNSQMLHIEPWQPEIKRTVMRRNTQRNT